MTHHDPDPQIVDRITELRSTDPQFAAAMPDEAVSSALDRPDMRLPDIIATVLDGYAERPALGQRAIEFTTDPQSGGSPAAAAPFRHRHLRRTVPAHRRAGCGARRRRCGRPGRATGLHQRGLHDHRHDAGDDRCGFGPAADQLSTLGAGTHRRRNRTRAHRLCRRPSRRRRRTGPHHSHRLADHRLRRAPRARRPPRRGSRCAKHPPPEQRQHRGAHDDR